MATIKLVFRQTDARPIDLADLSPEQIAALFRNYRTLDRARLKTNTDLVGTLIFPARPNGGDNQAQADRKAASLALVRWIELNNQLTAFADAEEQRIVTGRQSGEALN